MAEKAERTELISVYLKGNDLQRNEEYGGGRCNSQQRGSDREYGI